MDLFSFSSNVLNLKISGSISEMYDDSLTYLKNNEMEDYLLTMGMEL